VSSGAFEVVQSGGLGSATIVAVGGAQVLFGLAQGTIVNSGGAEYVEAGGLAIATTLNSGGLDDVFGTASGDTLNGGTQFLFGVANGGTIAGATQIIESGGTANGATLSSGLQDILSGGTASGTILRGGYEYVASGGLASATVISAGTLDIASGGTTGTGAVTFSGGGMLRLENSVHFGGLVAGFGVPDSMDLADINFISSTSASWMQLTSGSTASGTLIVTDGTHTAQITLLGQYAAGNFHIQNDGAGGTLVTDPPVSSTDPNQLALANTHHA
jgi:autotransporter passenger strand-loop-strand repeat protein